MSQAIQEPEVDVCILGLGVTGGIVAAELSLAGYKVVGIDKGPYWDYANDFASLRRVRDMYLRKFDHPLRMFTYTLRNDSADGGVGEAQHDDSVHHARTWCGRMA